MAKSSNGRTESFEKTLFKAADRKIENIKGNSRKILILWPCHLNDCGIERLGCVAKRLIRQRRINMGNVSLVKSQGGSWNTIYKKEIC